jgi:hypothetical protein
MAKETAVQWMARVFGIEIDYKTEIAEKMEKEQIIEAANFLPFDEQNDIKTGEQYYNETYGK